MDESEMRRRFAAAPAARLASVTPEGAPHVVPVTFALVGEAVYSAIDHKPKSTTRLKRLANIAAEPRVALLVDRYDPDWSRLWWIRADGLATEVSDAAERAAALDHLAAKYAQYRLRRPRGPIVRIDVHAWRGWSAAEA